MSRIRKAVFPIAGEACVRRPSLDTEARYAELRPIFDRPLIHFAIDEARAAGIEEFIFVTCTEKAELAEAALADWRRANADLVQAAHTTGVSAGEAIFVRQPKRRGVGDAVRCAGEFLVEEPFAVIIPNLLLIGERGGLSELIEAHQPGDEAVIGVVDVAEEEVSRFGIVDTEGESVTQIVEKPAPTTTSSRRAAFGRWILTSRVFDVLDSVEAVAHGEVSLTEAVNLLRRWGNVRACCLSASPFDLRRPSGLLKAGIAQAARYPGGADLVAEAQREFIDEGVRTPRSVTLTRRYGSLHPRALLTQLLFDDFAGEIALVSSFGADSVVLLHMMAQIDPCSPVLFNDTGYLFEETLTYQWEIAERLGLSDVRHVRPSGTDLQRDDPRGDLHRSAANACCHLRKTVPIQHALAPFGAWITGRKRYQSALRADLPLFEEDEAGRIKVNPLVAWSRDDIRAYMTRHGLPPHPLVAKGFPSIGCAPCTSPVRPGEDERSGRWRGSEKTECGIHLVGGRLVRRENG